MGGFCVPAPGAACLLFRRTWGAQASAAMGFVRENVGAQQREGTGAQPHAPSFHVRVHQASELIQERGSQEQPKSQANSCEMCSKGFSLHIM